MSYTPHQLNLITKTILKLMPAIAFFSSSVSFSQTVTGPGTLNDDFYDYIVESGTTIEQSNATAPTINILGGSIQTFTNNGLVKNDDGGAINISNIDGDVNNNNTIKGNSYAIKVINGAQTEINNASGSLIEGTQNAIIGENNFGLNNNGTINSKNGDAIQITNGTMSLKNEGVINSESASAIVVTGNGETSIINSGKIEGNVYAIKFESSKNNSLRLQEGSNLSGDVLTTNSKNNKLILEDKGSEDSNFVGLNEGDGFASLNMRGNAWTLSGEIDLLGNDDKTLNDKVLQVTSGTLTLTGTVNNAGGTTINEGAALQLGDATHTAAFTSDAVTNNGTLVFNQSGNSTFSSDISGTGKLIKSDASTLTLDGVFNYTGGTDLNGGTTLVAKDSALGTTTAPARININNSATLASAGTIAGNVNIMTGGTLAAWNVATAGNPASTTADTVNGTVNNSGSLVIGSTQTQPGQRFTINGDYVGNAGSQIVMNTTLADDSAATDRLTITGNTSGESKVALTNIGGQGAQTINGIEIISVGGSSDATFTLAAPATVGKWEYNLTKKNNDWFLVSEKDDDNGGGDNGGGDNGGGDNGGGDNGGSDNGGGDNGGGDNGGGDNDGGDNGGDNSGDNGGDNDPTPPEVPNPETGAYLGNYLAAQQMFIHKRDDREQLLARGTDEKNGWMYVRGRYHDNNVDGTLGSYNTKMHVIQMGSDLLTRISEEGEWHAGFMLGAGLSETHAQAALNKRSAKGHVSGYNVGLYATWQQDPELRLGSYIDSWVAANWYDSWVQGDRAAREDYSSNGFAASIEAGHAWLLDSVTDRHWKVEPQGQIVYSYLEQNDHTENDGTRIAVPDDDSYLTRLGVRFSNVDKTTPGAWQPWVAVNWLNGAGMNDLEFNGESAHDETPENRGQLEVGISGDLNKNMSISVRALGEWGENSYDAYGGHVLWNYRW
ncbi:autotransporter family protein [Enterobacter kobei]|uniref:Uncharacterized protein n=2 Tax=Enterobacter kobei TaxID=208224 RepID=A0ACC8S4U9_9ENTR|nr:autotransporter outer membrane beta-barrel domain-containing protein [Enterobacter kobei]OLR18554.1 hypothetical protein BH713_18970 [Enterobacter kobei]